MKFPKLFLSLTVTTVAVSAVLALGAQTVRASNPAVTAQNAEAKPPGAGWTTRTQPSDGAEEAPVDERPPVVLTPEQIEIVREINSYLNGLVNLEGRFTQTDHRNETTRGRFYVHRPGKLRFDYAAPSKLRIVSDGEYLSVEDHDLNTVDKFPLDATPIQLLLGEDVNLTRDAVILEMKQNEEAVTIVLRDKSGNSPGHLQLFFRRPQLELYEWVITDAQGLDTRIELADLVVGEEKDDGFFEASTTEIDNFGRN